MSRVTREQWRKAWAVMRAMKPATPPYCLHQNAVARLTGCDWLAFSYAGLVYWSRRNSDPLRRRLDVRRIMRWGALPRERIAEWCAERRAA